MHQSEDPLRSVLVPSSAIAGCNETIPPKQKIAEPIKIVFLRPSQSPTTPANIAPKNAPPVKTETTAPCSALEGLNSALKLAAAMAPAMTPRS